MTRARPWISGLLAFAALVSTAGVVQAAGPKETAAKKAMKQALEEDYLETRFDDAEQKLRAAIQGCGTSACSAEMRAKLHAALGAVLAGGKKELEDARDEFVEALSIDPKVEPNPDIASAEVNFAYEQARKKLKLASGTPAPAPPAKPPKKEPKKVEPEPVDKPEKPEKPEKPDDKGDKADDKGEDKEPEKPKEAARKNWVTVTFSPNISLLSGSNVCTKDSQLGSHYVCIRQDAQSTQYVGTPTKDNADNINAGLALSTMAVMIGYDRLLIDNLTLGARVGFAFNGASGGDAKFLPVHAEARFGMWPRHAPFSDAVVRPFFMLSGGLAQVDTKVDVQVLEDGNACGAQNPQNTSSKCTIPSHDGVVEKRQQTLTVYHQTGLGFGALAFGVQFAPTAKVGINLAMRASVTFPVVSMVLSPEAGISLGF